MNRHGIAQFRCRAADGATCGLTADAVRKRREESRCALQRRAGKLKMVSAQLDRVEAQLVSLSNEIEGLMTEVIRLQAMGAEEAGKHVPGLGERLREETVQLKQFEQEAVEV